MVKSGEAAVPATLFSLQTTASPADDAVSSRPGICLELVAELDALGGAILLARVRESIRANRLRHFGSIRAGNDRLWLAVEVEHE